MKLSVVLNDGRKHKVSKDELQFLLVTKRILFFERSNGWVVIGRDTMRKQDPPITEKEWRKNLGFALEE